MTARDILTAIKAVLWLSTAGVVIAAVVTADVVWDKCSGRKPR